MTAGAFAASLFRMLSGDELRLLLVHVDPADVYSIVRTCRAFHDQCTTEFYALQAQKNKWKIPANSDLNLARNAFNSIFTGHDDALRDYFSTFKSLVRSVGQYDDHIMNGVYVDPPTDLNPNTLQSFGCTTVPYLNRYENRLPRTPLVIVLNMVVENNTLDKHLGDDFQWLCETLDEDIYDKNEALMEECSGDVEDGIAHHDIFTIVAFQKKLRRLEIQVHSRM